VVQLRHFSEAGGDEDAAVGGPVLEAGAPGLEVGVELTFQVVGDLRDSLEDDLTVVGGPAFGLRSRRGPTRRTVESNEAGAMAWGRIGRW
jgi:hypothetical protein